MAFNLGNGNQAAQSRLKLQKERGATEEQAMPDARRVPIDRVRPNPFQVRQDFDSPEARRALEELAEDIRQRDILEPLIVRPIQKDGEEWYEIVAGERRYQAARIAKKTKLPVIVKENWTEQDARLASLAENLQRRDLTLVEEVQFFHALETEHNWTAKRIGELINKSDSYVSRRLRLAKDPQRLAEMSRENATLGEMLLRRHEEAERPTPDATAITERAKSLLTAPTERKLSSSARVVAVTRFREALDRLAEPRTQASLKAAERTALLEELDGLEEQIAALRTALATSGVSEKSHKKSFRPKL